MSILYLLYNAYASLFWCRVQHVCEHILGLHRASSSLHSTPKQAWQKQWVTLVEDNRGVCMWCTNHAAFCGTELSTSSSFWVLLEVGVRVKSNNNIRCSAVFCPQLPKQSVAEALKKDVWTSLWSHNKMALKLPLKPVLLCLRAAKCYRGIFDKASHVDWGLRVYHVKSESYIAWGFAVTTVTTLLLLWACEFWWEGFRRAIQGREKGGMFCCVCLNRLPSFTWLTCCKNDCSFFT